MELDADILPADADQHGTVEVDDADTDAGKGIMVVHNLLKAW